ncbi:toluene tolerance protein [Pseudomonas sp. GD03985]|jgi:RIO-like serine/threonine protein kinase|nr:MULTISPECIES: lipopolysaccharide kinase InaA family protein [unclassified Pseudomonas]MDG9929239.1 toluene tolerance protein [Pseudomonas sp. GD04042]MDH0484799.1 toluene tolerance protein [Pseudomonas sp. GD04015]MDH0605019.1 toluene tolerance protein [Pseudomonas sp. GD03869]MDH0893724.1 toluene tolerance protein [Pseudomonas sp. GD03875]MDH1063755.1 toluene tolerance protein [Pseudomonas sp. GD03985]
MRIVTANELQDWLSQGELLEKDSHGPKVVRLPSGTLLKIFRSRRNPLLARIRPDARRFAERASRLQAHGIRTPAIRECCWLERDKAVSACLYQPLAGQSLDSLFHNSRKEFDGLLPQLAAYILKLHRLGIYFRSLHLGNILLTPDGDFGLIDFLDLRFKNRPLGRLLVRRNFRHLQRYLERRQVQAFPWEELMQHYEVARSASS